MVRLLRDEYFRWKYTAPNRYATTTRELARYVDDGGLGDLDQIRKRLLTLDPDDVRSGLNAIHGLGIAGASGLLALMYPQHFGTVDQFVVKSLRQVDGLPEAAVLARMKPQDLKIRDGVLMIDIFRRKAADLNRLFKTDVWTPRKLDKVLWTSRPLISNGASATTPAVDGSRRERGNTPVRPTSPRRPAPPMNTVFVWGLPPSPATARPREDRLNNVIECGFAVIVGDAIGLTAAISAWALPAIRRSSRKPSTSSFSSR